MDENYNELPPTPVKIVKHITRRRHLLPWWVKMFTWFFIAGGAVMPLLLVMGALGYPVTLSLFGLQTNEPFSAIGLFLVVMFSFKGWVAYGLWWEKDWALTFARIDAILSMVICVAIMCYGIMNLNLNLRLELIAVIPYYFKMAEIKNLWQQFGHHDDEPVILNDQLQ